jgi:RNA polymerase sigma-70 factor (ECF subfamily)
MENTRLAYFQETRRPQFDAGAMERPAELSIDQSVFWELAGPHKQKLYNFIHKSLSFSEEADDVFQETLLRGLQYFHSYNKEKSFNTWLFAIAHNEVKKHFKNAQRQNSLPLEARLIVRDEQVRPDLVREVYRFAEALKPKHKEVFFLFYDSGFSISEISRITGLREGNVKFILNRARQALKERFGEKNGKQ